MPLTPQTHHLLDEKALSLTKPGIMIINTGRGALINTKALIQFLKSGHIGYAGLDVYEEEEGIFFENLSEQILHDDQLARLLTFPNVLLTSHQAFLTQEALSNIAQTTLQNTSQRESAGLMLFHAGLTKNPAFCCIHQIDDFDRYGKRSAIGREILASAISLCSSSYKSHCALDKTT